MASFLESVFEFLFKYRPLVFERGRLAFEPPWSVGPLVAIAALVVVVVLLAYTRGRAKTRADAVLLAMLRLTALALIGLSLSRPILLIPTVVPQRNFLGILVDDSRSMQIADRDGLMRSAFVQQSFGSPDSTLYAALADRFMLRFFRFSGDTERLDSLGGLRAAGQVTDLGRALDAARRELSAVPLSGLVLISDGADNSESQLTETLLTLQADRIPVYTVGLGEERFERDIQLSRVQTPRRVLQGSSVAVDLALEQTGYANQTVEIQVEDDGRIISTEEVRLPEDGETANVRVQFEASERGPRHFRFIVQPKSEERVTENNQQEALVVVDDRREKLLYFEGEPRWEVKFIRRAIADDDNLSVVVLQRTAENKFLRLEVENPDELASGFPKTREELFAYRALILGSVEASFFTHDQLQMIEEFVSQRGGGLLVLGGRLSLGRGGYQETPLADALPVVLREPDAIPENFFAEVRVEPTRFGRSHPAAQIAASADASLERWKELPAVSAVNPITELKPGASAILVGETDALDEPLIVLAHQRFGRGKALALPIHDSWTWQMHADIPLDDETHERFWRQILRWLVSYVPDPVGLTAANDRVAPGHPVDLVAEVQDETFLAVNNAEVIATLTAPSGLQRELVMDWTVDADGRYDGVFVPDERGLHRIDVVARKAGEYYGATTTYVEVADLATEFFDAEMRAPLLRQIAEETGGRFYTPGNVSSLPEDVSFTESGTTIVEERDLWNMPILFLLLIVFVGTEWIYRRRRGLA